MICPAHAGFLSGFLVFFITLYVFFGSVQRIKLSSFCEHVNIVYRIVSWFDLHISELLFVCVHVLVFFIALFDFWFCAAD